MYQVTDRQYDYILSDIRARGIEMESLQEDLADHICCIIEQQFEAGGNFEQLYASVITRFYKKDLIEIEEETKMLLHNKNYYAMKKIMIATGIFSATVLLSGIIFKFLHWPGAGFLIVIGITLFSLLFLPLMVVLKLKEKNNVRDKLLVSVGTTVAILISLATMFKIMHWPGGNMMGMTAIGMMFALYLPINLVTGIRNPDTKINTIVSSVLLVAGCGLLLSLVRAPYGSQEHFEMQTNEYLRYENLYQTELQFVNNSQFNPQARELISECEKIKSFIIEQETLGQKGDKASLGKTTWLGDTFLNTYIDDESGSNLQLIKLKQLVSSYTKSAGSSSEYATETLPLFNLRNSKVADALNSIVQIEMMVLQNEKKRMAGKG